MDFIHFQNINKFYKFVLRKCGSRGLFLTVLPINTRGRSVRGSCGFDIHIGNGARGDSRKGQTQTRPCQSERCPGSSDVRGSPIILC